MKYFILTNFVLDVTVKGHAISFEYIKRGHSVRQIYFTGIPLVIMGMKRLGCAHGVDRCVSSKKKRMENKIKQVKALNICSMKS